MALSPLAGKPVINHRHLLTRIPDLVSAYYTNKAAKKVEFGTSGHRGSSLKGSFNEEHILAITQAIVEYRARCGVNGPLYMGFDTHALSVPAFRTALEVLAANGVQVIINKDNEYTPTPVISRMIIKHNFEGGQGIADGIVITPSHNGPADGGFKYNPPHGGPADTETTSWIQARANELIDIKLYGVMRVTYKEALRKDTTVEMDFVKPFVDDIEQVVDVEAIRGAGIRIGVDPLGGSSVNYWMPIAQRYGLNIEVVNPDVEADFRFMTFDSDGAIRMDCSSPYAMANLMKRSGEFDIVVGADPDADRHGIGTNDGLMNPNHYLSVAAWYLPQHRPQWGTNLKFGKTLVSSTMIDRVVAGQQRELYEVPVGFKYFVQGLFMGWLAFGGEESAGATMVKKDGGVWTTDKDTFAMCLLAAEIMAKTGKTPSEIYNKTLVPLYGEPYYKRQDGGITDEQKAILAALSPSSITATTLNGLDITSVLTKAPGNQANVGGVKVNLSDGSWFAIRPSGTEPKMKVYVESFDGEALWQKIYDEALPLIFGDKA